MVNTWTIFRQHGAFGLCIDRLPWYAVTMAVAGDLLLVVIGRNWIWHVGLPDFNLGLGIYKLGCWLINAEVRHRKRLCEIPITHEQASVIYEDFVAFFGEDEVEAEFSDDEPYTPSPSPAPAP